MLDVFGFPTPQQSNYQEFHGGNTTYTWIKPRGASMVRFMVIGPGGSGGAGDAGRGGGGGGSGAVTSWIGPAIFIPDSLQITVAAPGANTFVFYRDSTGNENALLIGRRGFAGGDAVSGGNGGAGGSAADNNYFGAAGIFISTAGQTGGTGGVTTNGSDIARSTTTFLSAGGGGAGAAASTGGSVTPNYEYPTLGPTTPGGTVKGADGYFITQPILVGCGGAGGTTSETVGTSGGNGGIGCGGGGAGEDYTTTSGRGGDGAVFVWAW